MDITESVIQDTLKLDLLLESPIKTVSFDFVFQEKTPLTTGPLEALLLPTASQDPTVLAIEDAVTEVEAEYVYDFTNLFNIELDLEFDLLPSGSLGQLALGNLGAGSSFNFDSLYNDPIEYGSPLTEAYYWRQQQGLFSCAVVAQMGVYQSITGHYISEYDASVFAQQQGWFDPLTGTPVESTGHILDVLGIPTYEFYNASLDTLQQALTYGNKPIVGLDGSEIWNPMRNWDGSPIEQANAGHAVWVTGIDYEWNGSIGIVVNDSGHANGMASVIDYHDFMNAWQDYGYFVSVADNPFV
ncbi:MAG: hypothetical protein AAFN12_12390 [Cyanobacteria bacterium J06560_2]